MQDPVNAFSQLLTLQSAAKGPLQGTRFAVKDIFAVKGFSIQAGNPDYFQQARVDMRTARAVSILQKAGATLIGKTHTDELGGSLFGMNKHYGTPVNSNSPDHVPGGSSSGSAAAVAANLVDFALGGDTSGSVRAPASFCGIYGFRPTFKTISTAGVLPISKHLDTVGIFAQDPSVIAKILTVYGMEKPTKVKRLRPVSCLIDHLKLPLKTKFLQRLNQIQGVVDTFEPLPLEEEYLRQWSAVIRTIAMYGIWQTHKDWILKSQPVFGDIINDRIQMASTIEYKDYRAARRQQKQLQRTMDQALEPGDVAVFPTVHDIPPKLSSSLEEFKGYALNASRHTCIAALTGFPELTIPLRKIAGSCSLGMSFLGRLGADRSLPQLASAIHATLYPDDQLLQIA